MFSHRVTLFRVFGFAVKADASWLILAFLVTWSLAVGLFPAQQEGLSTQAYWTMGVLGAIGLFASIIVHEVGHSLVARHYGLPIKDITLFIFGGVADMEEEPPTPRVELLMAVAGPITSIVLALVFFTIAFVDPGTPKYAPLFTVVRYLGWLNGIVAFFNLLPAYPLDGGRVLRSALWALKGDLRWATYIASRSGVGFGWLLMALGIWAFIAGNLVGGVWWFLLGMFVRGASHMSYRHLLVQRVLGGEPVRRFMKSDPVTVPRHIPLREFVEEYVYKFHFKMFPVVDGEVLKGCISTSDVKDIAREEWDQHAVAELMGHCNEHNTVSPDEDAMKALTTMSRTGNSRLMVVRDGRLEGIVTLKDMLGFLALKLDLEGIDLPRN